MPDRAGRKRGGGGSGRRARPRCLPWRDWAGGSGRAGLDFGADSRGAAAGSVPGRAPGIVALVSGQRPSGARFPPAPGLAPVHGGALG